MANIQNSAHVEYRRTADRRMELNFQIDSEVSPEEITPPHYPSIVGRHALWVNEEWFSLQEDDTPISSHEIRRDNDTQVDSTLHLQSDEERTLKWVNIIWGSFAFMVLMIIVLYWFRKPEHVKSGLNIERWNKKKEGNR